MNELIELMKNGVNSPDSFSFGIGVEEQYNFKDIGYWCINRAECQKPEEIEKFKKGVAAIGLKHKYSMPEKWTKV